jgi:hypothetical protein
MDHYKSPSKTLSAGKMKQSPYYKNTTQHADLKWPSCEETLLLPNKKDKGSPLYP